MCWLYDVGGGDVCAGIVLDLRARVYDVYTAHTVRTLNVRCMSFYRVTLASDNDECAGEKILMRNTWGGVIRYPGAA